MLKLLRFLRPFLGSVVLIFALLFVQAMTDLELPDYMSRIVNVGIQQQGIAGPVPEAIRDSQLHNLTLLMNETDAAEVLQSFRLLDRNSLGEAEYADYIARYPLLAQENLRIPEDGAVLSAAAENALLRAETMLYFLNSGSEKVSQMISNLPAGTDIFAFLAKLPASAREQMLAQANEALAGISDSILTQTAVLAVISEYEAIGLDQSALQNRFMWQTGGMMLLIALLGSLCSVTVGLLAARVAAGFARDLRRAVFSHVENFSSAEFDRISTASLITRTTNDIQQIQMAVVMTMRILFYAPILGVGGILKVLRTDQSMSWIIALAVALLMTLIISLFTVAIPRFKMVQKLIDRLNLVTREILSGLMVIRAFNTEKHQERKFDDANRDLTRVNLFVSRLMVIMMPAMMLLMNGIMLLIIWVGAHQVDSGSMQVGDVMAFLQYAMQIIMSFLMVSMVFIMLPRASVSGQRIAEVLAMRPEILDPENPIAFPAGSPGIIEFCQVSFRYPNAEDNVLENISFTAKPGQTTAFIGSTGCGKSTLVNLIPRFYDITGGRILIDGLDIQQVPQKELRRRIGYVPQKGTLFAGDIQSNIRYGREDATDEDVRQAAATAQALDFIDASEQGFATAIAQGGANVSGGQKQRLAIARALVKKPDIFIFDDTFSALDYKTDAALRRALHRETSQSTVLIVAQRIGTIMHAEQIIVLENGRIAGIGTHQELLAGCPVYQEIASSQLSEEELAL